MIAIKGIVKHTKSQIVKHFVLIIIRTVGAIRFHVLIVVSSRYETVMTPVSVIKAVLFLLSIFL